MPEPVLGEVIALGQSQGLTVAVQRSTEGLALFSRPEGYITVYLYEARNPDFILENADVFLIAEQHEGEFTGRYAVMVDDAYWGRRIQPARFMEPPFTETLVMGYRLCGIIKHQGVPQSGVPVSLEVVLQTAEDGPAFFWDNEEYNELVWSETEQTFVSGPEVTGPVVTDYEGYWEFRAPRGHGAMYQRLNDRRDDTEETSQQPLRRYVTQVYVAYRGRKLEVSEGTRAELDLESGWLELHGTPGASVLVGVMDDGGQRLTFPESGELLVGNLPEAEISLVQYKRAPTGEWDPRYGCPRVRTEVREGELTHVSLPPLEQYPEDGSVRCGRVYQAPAVPAADVGVYVISPETGEVLAEAARTDENGFWSVQVPEQGLGGNLYVLDETWGSVPILGAPYSDVVLGARVYSWWTEDLLPEAWRTGTLGHKNFSYVPDSVWVEDEEQARWYETEPSPYGGWITKEWVPKYRYQTAAELFSNGPQLKSYKLYCDGAVVDPALHLQSQVFGNQQLEPDRYRASGYFLQRKLLMGGKIKHNVVMYSREPIGEQFTEAMRVGLEFGEHQPYVEVRTKRRTGLSGGQPVATCFSDLVCPYCGGPLRRTLETTGEVPRGYCKQCMEAWGVLRAMQGWSYARSVSLGGNANERYEERAVALTGRGGFQNRVRYHWRPDLYEENDDFLTRTGPGQITNAPRWWAKHPHQWGEGLGLGTFDSERTPAFQPAHDLPYYGALLGRDLGVAQLKLAFPPTYVAAQDFTLEVDCERADGWLETVRVTIPAGTQGPSGYDFVGEVVPLTWTPKLRAERLTSPYAGTGLYVRVRDMRLVEPAGAPGCQCVVTADVPYLADPTGIQVATGAASYVALQLIRGGTRPHLLEDAVGQLFLFRTQEGCITLRRRRSLTLPWEEERVIIPDGVSDYPWAEKDERGTMLLVRQVGENQTVICHSRDDGETWEEV
jgi:hypothetical protein